MTRAYCLAPLLVLLFGNAGFAQYGNPAWGYPTYHHASTEAEGRARGMADVIRSAGYANLQNSEAAKNYEDARSKELDNRLKGTQTYFEMRRLNKEYRAAERGPRPTSEQLFRIAKDRAPNKLGPTELDPLTGELNWPVALQTDGFSADRAKLDELYGQWAAGQLGGAGQVEVQSTAKKMQAELKGRIRDFSPGDYVAAKNFLDSVAIAARYPAG